MTTKIVLVGKTGQGKSTLGNFLLGRKEFRSEVSLASVTGEAKKAEGQLCDLPVSIVDMPGLMDAYGAKEDILNDKEGLEELAKGVKFASENDGGEDGVDVILYTIKMTERFSRDHALIFRYFEEQGEQFWGHVIVMFTHAGRISSDEEEQNKFLSNEKKKERCPEALKKLLEKASDNLVIVESENYNEAYRERKIREIVTHIKTIRSGNKSRYSTDMMRKTANNPKFDIIGAITGYIRSIEVSCFPGDARVILPSRKEKLMRDLRVGDKILCINSNARKLEFSEVIAFLHYQPNHCAQYLVINTKQGPTITVSSNHLIFTAKSEPSSLKAQPILAGEIKEGDSLIICDHQNQSITSEVTKVQTVEKQGVYAPLTRSGVIVVDGVMASCYASFHSHDLAHVAFAPLRLYSSISKGPPQPKEGIHGYAAALYKTVKYFFPHSVGSHAQFSK